MSIGLSDSVAFPSVLRLKPKIRVVIKKGEPEIRLTLNELIEGLALKIGFIA